MADFVAGWEVEHGARNKVVAVELWFRSKDRQAREATARELAASRVGRKARRTGQVERVVHQTDLGDALRAVRAELAPAGVARRTDEP